MKFKQQINEVHPSIKFDFNFPNNEINFLDTLKHNHCLPIFPLKKPLNIF